MMRLATAALAMSMTTSGCNLLFRQSSEVTDAAPDAIDDRRVELVFIFEELRNGSNEQPEVHEFPQTIDQDWQYSFDGKAWLAAEVDAATATVKFSRDNATQAYFLRHSLSATQIEVFEGSAARGYYTMAGFGRKDATSKDSSNRTLTIPSAASSVGVMSTGVWGFLAPASTNNWNDASQITYRTANKEPALRPRGNAGDRMRAIQFVGLPGGLTAISGATAAQSVDLESSANATIAGPYVATRDPKLHIRPLVKMALGLIQASNGLQHTMERVNWKLLSVPIPIDERQQTRPLEPAGLPIVNGIATLDDLDFLAVQTMNPFPHSVQVLHSHAEAQYIVVKVIGSSPTQTTATYDVFSQGNNGLLETPLDLAVPRRPTLNGTVMSETQVNTVGATDVNFSFTIADDKKADDFIITLYRVDPNNGVSVLVEQSRTHTSKRELRLQFSAKQLAPISPSRTFVLSVTSRYGYPVASKQDYRARTFPFGESTVWTPTFVVQ
jgi:hypothetical protein